MMDRSPPGSPPASNMRHDRMASASPPPHREAHLSKRDKRRTMLQERLAEMTAQFTHTRDQHYREQLQALQLDMNLIMEADCYTDVPIVSDPAGVDQLVRQGMAKMKNVGPSPPPGAGRLYAKWAKGINDNIEERDANMVIHKRNFDNKLNELNAAHAYRVKVANEEYKALSKTVRDRLINSITMKKNRLAKDKDNVEIGESSAALLHPSQYGHNNPASPGGIHGKRASRHRRDAEDVPALEGNKRKRRTDVEDSPAPTRQRLENGASTPLWFSEKQSMFTKQLDSPLFSIEKLFTEKELALTYNTACIAAHNHMVRHPPFTDDLDSPPNGKSDSSSDQEKATNGVEGKEAEEPESPPGGAAMERQYSHATRSTRANYVTGLGIDALADINAPGNFQALTKQIPKLPPFLSYGTTKVYSRGEASNSPAPLPYDDVQAELDLIRRARLYNAEKGLGSNLELENGGRTILEMACEPRRFEYWISSDNRNALDRHGGRERKEAGDESDVSPVKGGGMGGVDMERINSGRSAISEFASGGGVAMSRSNTGDGGAGSARRRNGVRREF